MQSFYSTKEVNSSLLFQAEVSTCAVDMLIDGRTVTIEDLTVYQTLTLLLLNTRDEIKPRELAVKFDLQKEEIIAELAGLVFNEEAILIKSPAEGDLEDSHALRVNRGIKPLKNFVKISPYVKKELVGCHSSRNKTAQYATRNSCKRRKLSSRH